MDARLLPRRIVATGWLSLAGCSGPAPAPPSDESAERPPIALERTEPFRTNRREYRFVLESDVVTGKVEYRYTNHSARAVHFANCGGSIALHLERKDPDGWRSVWTPMVPACLSPPVTVRPGEVLEGAVPVRAGTPGSEVAPTFPVDRPAATYRLVGSGMSDDLDRYPRGPDRPLDERVSNPFVIRLVSR